MRVLILGLGSSGGGAEAAEYYLKLGNSVEIIGSSEKRENEPMVQLLESEGAVFITKDKLMDSVEKADLVVKIPGVPVPFLVKKKAKHITNDIAALLEKAQQSDNMNDLQTINEKGEALKENLHGELEEAAQAWSGKTLDVAAGEDLTVITPITVTFDGFFSSTSPQYTLSGDVETAREIDAKYSANLLKYYSSRQNELLTYGVLLVGLDEQGQQIVSQRVGSVQLAWATDRVVIPAKTKVKFDSKLAFNDGAADKYAKIKSLTLKVDSK